MKGDNNKLLCSYKVRFNTQQEYKSSRRCCVCVYATETKYAPRNPSSFFIGCCREKKEEGHEEFLSKTLSLPRERGGKTVTCKHLEKLYKLYIFSVPPVFTHWMDALKECELSYDNPENRKEKKERNGHSKSTQEVTAEFGGLDKIQRRQVQVSLWSQ